MRWNRSNCVDVSIDERQILAETDKAILVRVPAKAVAAYGGWKFWQPKKLTQPSAKNGRLFVRVPSSMEYKLYSGPDAVYMTGTKLLQVLKAV